MLEAAGHPRGVFTGGSLLYGSAGRPDLRHHRPVVILDVRRDREWEASHIAGALHVPIR